MAVLLVCMRTIYWSLCLYTFSLFSLRTRSFTYSSSAFFMRFTCCSSCSRIFRCIVFLPYFLRFSAMILSIREVLEAEATLRPFSCAAMFPRLAPRLPFGL